MSPFIEEDTLRDPLEGDPRQASHNPLWDRALCPVVGRPFCLAQCSEPSHLLCSLRWLSLLVPWLLGGSTPQTTAPASPTGLSGVSTEGQRNSTSQSRIFQVAKGPSISWNALDDQEWGGRAP